MFARILVLIAAIAGAVTLSQFPEFSQQYLQRLAGQHDALTKVVAEFDASAAKAGLTRDAALADLSGSAFRDLHQGDMRRTVARQEQMTRDLALLRALGPLERLALPHRLRDTETMSATWADFQPAVPVTLTGFIAAGIGFVAGWLIMSLILAGFRAMFFRKQRARSW